MSKRTLRRFTPEEDDIIRTDYGDYVDVRTIATTLVRDWGTVRQRIFHLGLKRDNRVTRMLQWCPDHLKPLLKEKGGAVFIKAYSLNATKAEDARSADEKAQMDARMAEIVSSPLERKEKMM